MANAGELPHKDSEGLVPSGLLGPAANPLIRKHRNCEIDEMSETQTIGFV